MITHSLFCAVYNRLHIELKIDFNQVQELLNEPLVINGGGVIVQVDRSTWYNAYVFYPDSSASKIVDAIEGKI